MRWGAWVLSALLVGGCTKRPEDEIDPKALADGYYVAGTTAYLKGDFAEAHRRFAEVRSVAPKDPRLPAAEGETYLSEGNLPEAIRCFEEASALDPRRATNWSRLGALYVLKNELPKARAALDKALSLNAHDSNAHEALGDLLLKQGDVDGGLHSFVTAAEVAQGPARAELILKATAELTRRQRLAETLPLLEAAVKAGIDSPALQTELGDRLVEAGRLPDAVVAYSAAAAKGADDPTLWELVGEVELRLAHPAEAEAAFRKSLAVKDRAVVHVALARLCQAKKDEACLNVELDKALATASGEELREGVELADLLASLGREKDALSLLKTLAEEPDQKANVELQLKTARLAKTLKDSSVVQAACARALAAASPGLKCP